MTLALTIIRGRSMEPILWDGQEALLRLSPAPQELRPGRAVAFREASGRLVLHRLQGQTRTGLLIARGDNAGCPDPPWTPSQVEGILEAARSPKTGQWMAPRPMAERLLALAASRNRIARACRPLLRLLQGLAWKSAPAALEEAPASALSLELLALWAQGSAASERWIVKQMGDEWGVFDQETEDYHVLNEEALTIWTEARGGASEEAIVERLLSQYPDAGRERVTEDVAQTVEQLRKVGLLP